MHANSRFLVLSVKFSILCEFFLSFLRNSSIYPCSNLFVLDSYNNCFYISTTSLDSVFFYNFILSTFFSTLSEISLPIFSYNYNFWQ